jgi:hypothetical protein
VDQQDILQYAVLWEAVSGILGQKGGSSFSLSGPRINDEGNIPDMVMKRKLICVRVCKYGATIYCPFESNRLYVASLALEIIQRNRDFARQSLFFWTSILKW